MEFMDYIIPLAAGVAPFVFGFLIVMVYLLYQDAKEGEASPSRKGKKKKKKGKSRKALDAVGMDPNLRYEEVASALRNLGYSKDSALDYAHYAVDRLGPEATTEELIKKALKSR